VSDHPDTSTATPAVAVLRHLARDLEQLRTLPALPTEAALTKWADLASEALRAEEQRWLSEDRARRRGRSLQWLRRRFAALEAAGLARWLGGRRQYHEHAVPVQALEPPRSDDARQQARRDA